MMRFNGLTIGGKVGLCPKMEKVRFIPILSYHNQTHTTWLWGIKLRRAIADEKRAFRYLGPHTHDRSWTLQFWAWSIVFAWQESGRFRDYQHQRRARLSRLFGIKFDGEK